MANSPKNKYRAAVEVLQRGRDTMMDALAEDIVHQAENLLDSPFLFNEFLETQGTRVHFLTLLLSQLEQSAEQYEEASSPGHCDFVEHSLEEPAPPPKRRRSRSKKVSEKSSSEGSTEGSAE